MHFRWAYCLWAPQPLLPCWWVHCCSHSGSLHPFYTLFPLPSSDSASSCSSFLGLTPSFSLPFGCLCCRVQFAAAWSRLVPSAMAVRPWRFSPVAPLFCVSLRFVIPYWLIVRWCLLCSFVGAGICTAWIAASMVLEPVHQHSKGLPRRQLAVGFPSRALGPHGRPLCIPCLCLCFICPDYIALFVSVRTPLSFLRFLDRLVRVFSVSSSSRTCFVLVVPRRSRASSSEVISRFLPFHLCLC